MSNDAEATARIPSSNANCGGNLGVGDESTRFICDFLDKGVGRNYNRFVRLEL